MSDRVRTADLAREKREERKALKAAWYTLPKDSPDVAMAIWAWAEMLRQRQRADNTIDLIHEAIYEGRPMGSAVEQPALAHLRRQKSTPSSLNVTRSMVDTIVARRCKRRPFPVLSADDAAWSEKMYGKRASRVLRRKLGRPDVERMKPDIYRDSTIRGTGCTKVIRRGGDVTYERIPRHELVCDPREARYGLSSLPQMAHVKPYSRARILADFPEHARAVAEAPAVTTSDEWSPYDYDAPNTSDRIDVIEGWYLPTLADGSDGRHVITLRGHVLLDEGWTRARFPVSFNYWSSPVRGVWGHGLVEDLAGSQAKLNDMWRDVQEALYWGSGLKIFSPRGSNINKAHMRGRHPIIVEHDGAVAQFVAPNPVSTQLFQGIELLYQKMYEIAGINQASAASKSALGSNASGKALDTQYDIESDRFANVEIGDAMWMCDLGQLTIDEARSIAEDYKAKRRGIGKGKDETRPAAWITEIDWSDVDVDSGAYHLSIEPENFLPTARAGKLAYVGEVSKAGLITGKEQILSLFDEPDMARANRYLLGPIRHIEAIIENICDPAKPLSECMSEPHMDQKLALKMVVGEFENALAEGLAAEDNGEAIRERFLVVIDSIEAAIKKANAGAMAPAPGAQAGAPGALPPPPMDPGAMPLAAPPPPMATMPMPAPGMA